MKMRHATSGFTLLEMLLVILITGVLAALVAPLIREPVNAYFAQTGRAALVDAAEMALRRVARDVRRSLPYSVRINAAQSAVEFVRIVDVARYRESPGGGVSAARRLRFNGSDDSFNVLGTFGVRGTGTLAGNERLVVFNLGSAGYDIYQGDAVATPPATTVTISADGNEHNVTMNPPHPFAGSSPSHRVYIAEGATSYACSGGGLYRASGYGYLAAQPAPATVASSGVLLADNVVECRFDYDPGNSRRSGLLVMSLTLARNGERITLLHQVHVPNAT